MTVASDSSPAALSTGKSKAWPPGFRFHPTDEELVLFYLKRRMCKKKFVPDVIAETDVYKWDPEELPGQSALQNGDRQWFFFSPRDRRYPNGGRSNRATRHGYWKATGKDRCISCNSRNVGVKKTLVYYKGRAPTGERTDWVMHEYTLDEEELKRCLSFKEYYALYKVFKKSGPGPKNGEQYGAPFNEEEWADDDYIDFNCSPAYIEFSRKKVGEVTSIDTAEVNCQGQVSLNGDDIDDIIKSIASDPVFDVPRNAEYPYSLSLAAEVEIPCSDVVAPATFQVDDPVRQRTHDFNLSMPVELPLQESSEVTSALATHQADYPVPQQYLQPTYDFSQSTSLQLPIHESSEVTSAFSTQQRDPLVLGVGDFLEVDDLLSPDMMLANADKSAESLQFDDLDGLGEYDLYHDAAAIFGDMGSIDPETNSLPYVNTFDNNDNSVLNHHFQMHSNPEVSNQNGHELWMCDPGNTFASANLMDKSFSQHPSGLLNESGNFSTQANHSINDTDRSWNRFSSALWSFVESIPTNPASASEIVLASRAFERMSSFNKIVKQTSAAAVGNIPYDATEEQLIEICREVGPVVSFRLVIDRETGKPKGYGFCEYKDEETALSACRNLQGYEINGRQLRVDFAENDKNNDKNREWGRGGPGLAANVESQRQLRVPVNQQDLIHNQPTGVQLAVTASMVMAGALGGPQAGIQSNQSGLQSQAALSYDPLTAHLAKMSLSQLTEIMSELKMMATKDKDLARQLLLSRPQLSKALFQAQIMLNMVTPQVLQMPNLQQPPGQLSPGQSSQQPEVQTTMGLPPSALNKLPSGVVSKWQVVDSNLDHNKVLPNQFTSSIQHRVQITQNPYDHAVPQNTVVGQSSSMLSTVNLQSLISMPSVLPNQLGQGGAPSLHSIRANNIKHSPLVPHLPLSDVSLQTLLPPEVQVALLQQVLSLTPEQLTSLPIEQQQLVIQLQEAIRRDQIWPSQSY